MQIGEQMGAFRAECSHAAAVSREVLRKLLQENRNTEYGITYGFGDMADLEEYRKLPLTEYADFAEAIRRMQAGERNVLTAYEPKYFLKTSGSSGVQKTIPLTQRALEQGWDLVYAASLAQMQGMEEKKHLHTSVFRIDEKDRETLLSCAYFQYFREKDSRHCEKYIGGERLLFSKEIGDVCYVKLWLALSEPSLYSIQSIFLYDVLLLLQYFTKHWKEILQDMTDRRIPPEIPLSKEVREALLSLPLPKQHWFEKVRQECEKGFDGIVHRLWGECAFVSGIGGSSYGTQEQVLRQFLGDIPIHYFTYTSTEALIGIALEMESPCYVCIPHSGFLEFLPYGEETEKTKWMEEVEVGKSYELVITNFSGLYRYRLQDVVEVVGFYGEAPVIRYLFRKNQAVNIAGEKTDLLTIAEVMKELAEAWQMMIYEYSVCVDETALPHRYCFFMEAEWRSHTDEEYSVFLDEALKRQNPDYLDLRNLEEIQPPVCFHVQEGAHGAWKAKQGKGGHNKPLQYSPEHDYGAFMKERIQTHGTGR